MIQVLLFHIDSTLTVAMVRVVPELIRGGGWAPPVFFLNGEGVSGRIFFLWVGGSEKNSNSCQVGSLSNWELIN